MKIFDIIDYILNICWSLIVWVINILKLFFEVWKGVIVLWVLSWLTLGVLGIWNPTTGLIAYTVTFYIACKQAKKEVHFDHSIKDIFANIVAFVKCGVSNINLHLPNFNFLNSKSSPEPTTTQSTQSTPQTHSVDDDRRPVSVVCSPSSPHFVNIYDKIGRLRNTVQVTQGNIIGQPVINGNVFTVTVNELGQKFVKTFSMENGSQKSIVKIQ